MKNHTQFSSALQEWFAQHGPGRDSWLSALSAGKVLLTDVAQAPKGIDWNTGGKFGLIADFDPFLKKTWSIIKTRMTGKQFALHDLWATYAHVQKWSAKETAQRVAAWSMLWLRNLNQKDDVVANADAVAWLAFTLSHAQEFPLVETQMAYLVSLEVMGPRAFAHAAGDGRFQYRRELNDRVNTWWDQLLPTRQQRLLQLAEEQDVYPSPSLQAAWMGKLPITKTRVARYLRTLQQWWEPEVRLWQEEQLLARADLLTTSLPQFNGEHEYQMYLLKLVSPETTGVLWRADANRAQGFNVLAFVQRLHSAAVLEADIGNNETPQTRLLKMREQTPVSERLKENITWVEPGQVESWQHAWWKRFAKEPVVDKPANRLTLLVQGVANGLPLPETQRILIWTRYALCKPGKLHKQLCDALRLDSSTEWEQAMDAWLENWFPGQPPLLTVARDLGMCDDPKQLEQYIKEVLQSRLVLSAVLPAGLDTGLSV